MKLLTDEIKKIIPNLGDQEKLGLKAISYAKFFTPDSSWTWYATEFDDIDIFFGLGTKARILRFFKSGMRAPG